MDWEKEDSGVENARKGEDIEDMEVLDLVDDEHHHCNEQCKEKHKIHSENYPDYSWD